MENNRYLTDDFHKSWGIVLDFLPDPVLLHDGAYIRHVNRSACLLFESASPSQVAGLSYMDRIHPDDREFIKGRILSVFQGKPTTPHEYRIFDLDGGVKYVEAQATSTVYNGVPCNLVILRDITTRKKQESILLELNSQLHMMQERQTQLSRRLITNGERQSAALAMELHDRIGQPLSSIKMTIERILTENGGLAEPVRNGMEESVEALKQSILELKRVSSELLPSIIANLGLAHSLNSLRDKVTSKSGLQVHVFTSGLAGHYCSDLEVAVYRVIQEGVNNAAKHSGAANCFVNLLDDGKALSLGVEDDGDGFDVGAQSMASGGTFNLGLHIMRERIEQLGGEFTIDSSPGCGTSIMASIPTGSPDCRSSSKDV